MPKGKYRGDTGDGGMGAKDLTAEERAAYKALANAAARLRTAQERAEQQRQAGSRATQTCNDQKSRRDG